MTSLLLKPNSPSYIWPRVGSKHQRDPNCMLMLHRWVRWSKLTKHKLQLRVLINIYPGIVNMDDVHRQQNHSKIESDAPETLVHCELYTRVACYRMQTWFGHFFQIFLFYCMSHVACSVIFSLTTQTMDFSQYLGVPILVQYLNVYSTHDLRKICCTSRLLFNL